VYSSRNCEYGFSTLCLWFLYAILAKCSAVVPYFSMCSRPALPKSCGVGGARAAYSRRLIITIMCWSIGLVRSMNLAPSEPFSIFSKPSASTQSEMPPCTNWRAMYSAVEPVAQLLLTLYTGTPVMPSG